MSLATVCNRCEIQYYSSGFDNRCPVCGCKPTPKKESKAVEVACEVVDTAADVFLAVTVIDAVGDMIGSLFD